MSIYLLILFCKKNLKMLKKDTLFIVILLFNFVINAQKTFGIIEYTHIHKLDTIKQSKISKTNFNIIFDGENTYSYNLNLFKNLQMLTEKFNNDFSNSNYKPSPREFFVYNYKSKLNEFYDKVNVWYKTSEIIDIKWQLSNEEKSFLNFKCQKATCNFRGRDYEAWFTTEIPLPIAPWKLKGLPGAVLYAVDKTGSVEFIASSVNTNTTENIIEIPKNVEYLTVEKYKEIKDNYLNNLNLNFTVTKNGEDFKPSNKKRKAPTNPIELTK